MTLDEANARLKKSQITEEQLWQLNSLYILLDLDKSDFCKIVDTVGLETVIKKQPHYDRLLQAADELTAKEKYLQAKSRLADLEDERKDLEQVVQNYNLKRI